MDTYTYWLQGFIYYDDATLAEKSKTYRKSVILSRKISEKQENSIVFADFLSSFLGVILKKRIFATNIIKLSYNELRKYHRKK